MKKITFSILFVWLSLSLWAARQPEFSTAGFFRLDNSGREVYSMNPAWRFHKGAVEGAETKEFNDKDWTVVSLPDGIEYLPTEASGCINYQGEVWYRKHFTPDAALKGKKLFLHFEAIMGKSKVFVNGKLLTEHFGGYLPVIADVTDVLDWNGDNVIAVWADNSDDPSYPPGKAQDVLDYTYFGGIYRDCWLIAHNNVFITDPNYENEVAGGGLFVAFGKVSDALAEVQLKIHVRNATKNPFSGRVEYMLLQPDGTEVARLSDKIQVKVGRATTVSDRMPVKQPMLWTPSTPTLYNLLVRVLDKEGNVIDGYRRRIGIRSIEFKGKDGFWLNGKPYEKCGAIYGHLGAKQDKIVKKPGEWNHMRIRCVGQRINVILNGKKVTEMDMSKWTSGTVNPDGSEIPSWLPKPFAELPTKGYIGLQGKHGDSLIWFRNVKIRSIK